MKIHEVKQRQSRRAVLLTSAKLAAGGALSVMALRGGLPAVRAQEASPAAGGGAFANLGLPVLNVTATDTGYEGLPTETPAGRYLVNFTNSAQQPSLIDFLMMPEGVDVTAIIQPPAAAALATPELPEAAGSPAAGSEAGGPPDWYYTTSIAGGAGAFPGQTVQMVLDLPPGNFIAWAEDPTAPITPASFRVTGEMATPAVTEAPQAAVTVQEIVTESGFGFQIEGDFATGAQVVAVANLSDQPHFVEIDRTPSPLTVDQVMQLVNLPMGGTPPPGLPNPADIEIAAFIGTQSQGTTQWRSLDLDPGDYVLLCWVPDPTRGGIPHAMEGMVAVFSVGDAAGEAGAMASPTT
jgi:hypothetical protein